MRRTRMARIIGCMAAAEKEKRAAGNGITDRSFCAGESFYDFKINEEGIKQGIHFLHYFWGTDNSGGLGKLCAVLVSGLGLQGFHCLKLGGGSIICLCDQ